MEDNIAIIGSGSWATALAKIVLQNRMTIGWWVRKQSNIDEMQITGKNPHYLTSMRFDPSRVDFSTDLNAIAAKYNTLIFAVPSPYVAGTLANLTADVTAKTWVIATKGMIPPAEGTEGKYEMVPDYLHEHFNVPYSHLSIVTGPCHAEEIAMERLSYLTIASESEETAETVAELLAGDFVHTCTSKDVLGLEYSSVMKNIYAVAAGMCQALHYGDNFQAVLVSNATKEIKAFTTAASTEMHHVSESGYLGDLLVTTYSQFSRNRQFGQMIGLGYSVRAAQLEMGMIAEGYFGTKALHEANKSLGVSLPIADAMYEILYENGDVEKVITELTHKIN